MDTTSQIKNKLISKIKNSNDLNFLKALETILDSSEQTTYGLSGVQEEAIQIGRKEIKEGKSVKNDQVISGAKEWLKKK